MAMSVRRCAGRGWLPLLVLVLAAITACGGGSTKAALTVYSDAPRLTPVDVGAPGNSPGDAYYFFATLRDQPGGAPAGELYGTKTLVKPATPSSPGTEQRATQLFFVFGDRQDQIVVAGVPDYPPNAPVFQANLPVLRAVLGGTGKYNGAGGQLTSTRNSDGSYKQEFSLTKP
ncbi:MAG: hypothetical protein JWR32_658 [Mycobacterium sp.]|jgi:hypothetical protein|nr:hypothetical protein [Mycobacterium sp.]